MAGDGVQVRGFDADLNGEEIMELRKIALEAAVRSIGKDDPMTVLAVAGDFYNFIVDRQPSSE